jgi:hypothetical protein
MGEVSPQPFRMHVADETLRDLRERLTHVRWPDEPPGTPWLTGSSVDYVRELVGYWRDGFDWRAQETALNRFQQFKVPLGGIDLHFIHEQGKGPNPMPLLMSHGWPGSILEFHKILPMLADPALLAGIPGIPSPSWRRRCQGTPCPSLRGKNGSASRRSASFWPI